MTRGSRSRKIASEMAFGAPPIEDGSGPAVLLLRGDGAVAAATAQATVLLARAARPDDVAAALRALHARAAEEPRCDAAIASLPATAGGRIVLRAAGAGAYVAVTVELAARRHHELPDELTPREREVVRLTVRGLPTKLVALELGISPWTVTAHLRSIYDKCGIASRSELAALVLGAARAAG